MSYRDETHEALRIELRRGAIDAHRTFMELVTALNARDSLDERLHRPRHPLPLPVRAFLEPIWQRMVRLGETLQTTLDRLEARRLELEKILGPLDEEDRPASARPAWAKRRVHTPRVR